MPENQEIKPLTAEEMEEKTNQTHPNLKNSDFSESFQTPSIALNNENSIQGKSNAITGGEGYIAMTWVCLIVAVCFTIFGIYTLYNNDYTAKIVGGDAYNYIIYATRGTALICVGIVSAAIGLTMAMLANIEKNSKRKE